MTASVDFYEIRLGLLEVKPAVMTRVAVVGPEEIRLWLLDVKPPVMTRVAVVGREEVSANFAQLFCCRTML